MKDREYLGDSVYVGHDGWHIWLTTENGEDNDPSNSIALEPSVVRALGDYVERLNIKFKNQESP